MCCLAPLVVGIVENESMVVGLKLKDKLACLYWVVVGVP